VTLFPWRLHSPIAAFNFIPSYLGFSLKKKKKKEIKIKKKKKKKKKM